MPTLDLTVWPVPSSAQEPSCPRAPSYLEKVKSSHLDLSSSSHSLLLSLNSRPSGSLISSNLLGRFLPQGLCIYYPSPWNVLYPALPITQASVQASTPQRTPQPSLLSSHPCSHAPGPHLLFKPIVLATIQTAAHFTLLFWLFTTSSTMTSAP